VDQPTTIKKYHVTLADGERSMLGDLLKADESDSGPAWSDEAIRKALDVGLSTVARVRERFVEEGLEAALERHKPRRDYSHLVDGECEAHLVALACSAPPVGHKRWTLRLLADKMIEREYIDCISHETVRQVLKKTNLSPG
jgi:transposase